MNGGEDRRVRITKRAIKESLIELMQEYPITKISVKMICDAADINRSTFYAHYTDPSDLLKKIEQDVILDLKKHVASIRFNDQTEQTVPVVVRVLEYARENAALLKALLGGNGDTSFRNELMYLMQEKMIEEIREDKRLDARITKYVELFVISGVQSLIYKWLEDGCTDDTGKLAEMTTALLLHGVYGRYR